MPWRCSSSGDNHVALVAAGLLSVVAFPLLALRWLAVAERITGSTAADGH